MFQCSALANDLTSLWRPAIRPGRIILSPTCRAALPNTTAIDRRTEANALLCVTTRVRR